MSEGLLRRPHVWHPGSSAPPLLLLHGTGGDEHDLLVLRQHLAPDAPVLSPRGTVLEQGMARFFRRLREGVFDEDDLRLRADELAAFLTAAEQKYDVTAGS
jgi:phospholipase/carboxylesterase